VQVFGEVDQPASIPVLLDVAKSAKDAPLQMAALGALQNYGDPRVPEGVIALHDTLPDDPRLVAHAVIASRIAWAKQFLQAMGEGKVDKELVPLNSIRKILLHNDDELRELVNKNWGTVQNATTEQMREHIAKFTQVIASGTGNPYEGKKVYREVCGKC